MLKALIEEELKISSILESTIFEHKEFDFYRTNVEFSLLIFRVGAAV